MLYLLQQIHNVNMYREREMLTYLVERWFSSLVLQVIYSFYDITVYFYP